jgi:hypothetical protein
MSFKIICRKKRRPQKSRIEGFFPILEIETACFFTKAVPVPVTVSRRNVLKFHKLIFFSPSI